MCVCVCVGWIEGRLLSYDVIPLSGKGNLWLGLMSSNLPSTPGYLGAREKKSWGVLGEAGKMGAER